MPAIRLEKHSSSQVFKAMQRMLQDQGFTYNPDLSETEVGKLDKEFKLIFSQVDQSSRSNNQSMRVTATVEIMLYHNAEGDTAGGNIIALDDTENVVFEIERFAPSINFDEIKNIVEVTNLLRWNTDPAKVGDDSRLRTIVLFEITYKIRNPLVKGV